MTAPGDSTLPTCDGLCVDSADIGVPGYGIAYPHPGCPLHDPDERCRCGVPNCISYTHDPSYRTPAEITAEGAANDV